ncbi:hypothetical protein TNCV_2440021 [Trichonephila clavipes]|nr:hypothetical protein TNCV_2440021 [Trichonephila clavipes]
MSLSSFRVHQDATGQQSSASTEKIDKHPPPSSCVFAVGCRCHRSAFIKTRPDCRVVPQRKKVTNTHRRAAEVGCRCHRSACKKTRPYSRVLPRRRKSDEHPPPTGCGRMSLSSFRVHPNATGKQSSATTEKGDKRPPPRGRVACRCHLSACTKTRPDSRVVARRKKGTNTHRQAAAVGCRRHHSAYKKTRPDSGIGPRRKNCRTPTTTLPRYDVVVIVPRAPSLDRTAE